MVINRGGLDMYIIAYRHRFNTNLDGQDSYQEAWQLADSLEEAQSIANSATIRESDTLDSVVIADIKWAWPESETVSWFNRTMGLED